MSKGHFLLSDDWCGLFTDLPDEQAGQLIKSLFSYHVGEDFSIDDPVLAAVFGMIRAKIDENDRKYEEACRAKAEAGRAGGLAKASNAKQALADASCARQDLAQPSKTKQNLHDNDSDSEYEYENDSEYESDSDSDLNTHSVSKKENVPKGDAKEKAKKTVRHKFGEYGHVLLTNEQHNRLVNEFGVIATARAIKKVDEYCQERGKKYNDYNLVLRKWGFDDSGGLKKLKDPVDSWLAREEARDDKARVFASG